MGAAMSDEMIYELIMPMSCEVIDQGWLAFGVFWDVLRRFDDPESLTLEYWSHSDMYAALGGGIGTKFRVRR